MQPSQKQPSQMQASIGAAPTDLYNANLALCLRVNELVQIGGQQCYEAGTRLVENAVSESRAGVTRALGHKSGVPTTTSTSEAVRGGIDRWAGHVRAERSLAFDQQRSFSTGLREAVTTWQDAVNGSLARNDGRLSFADAWVAEVTKWTQAWPVAGRAK